MRVILSGGGTAGHIYPALAIANALEDLLDNRADCHSLDLLYIGTSDGQESSLVKRYGLPIKTVSSGPIRGRSPLSLIQNSLKMIKGYIEARSIVKEFKPDAILSTGGYASFPISLAAYTHGIKLLVYLPDIEPGWAVRAISKMANHIAVSTESASKNFPPNKTIVTGYPVRKSFENITRSKARQALNMSLDEKIVLDSFDLYIIESNLLSNKPIKFSAVSPFFIIAFLYTFLNCLSFIFP